jgi:hypothetical protein
MRTSTRLRVELPVTVTSLDRRHPFTANCLAVVVNSQGCGFRATQSLPLETPVLLADLPGGSISGRVVNCVPLPGEPKNFLIGVTLYNPGNVWGIANPPADWDYAFTPGAAPIAAARPSAFIANGNQLWPYNMFSAHGEAHPGRK